MNKKRMFGLVLGTTLGLGAASAHAQSSAPPTAEPMRTFVNKSSFYLPINIDERHRSSLREVQLFVKEGAGKPWTLRERVPPTTKFFTFQAPRDGEYSFTVVTLDQNGRTKPANVDGAAAAMTVMLDTEPPLVEISSMPATQEGQNIRCRITDVHLDAAKTKFMYQSGDMAWRPLFASRTEPDVYCIPAQAVHTGMIRVLACDLAGNMCPPIELNVSSLTAGPFRSTGNLPLVPVIETKVEEIVPATPLPGPTLPVGKPAVEEKPPVSAPAQVVRPQEELKPAPDLFPKAVEPVEPIQQVSNAVPRETKAPAPKGELLLEAGAVERQVVNSTRVYLEYQIEAAGASGVGKVEIWLTRDHGQSWQRHGEDTDRQSPAEVNLPGEGVFGIALVISNGRGFSGNAPKAGDSPDQWIEVDVTNPTAELLSVRPAGTEDPGTFIVSWTARDKNLAAEPIDLYYAPSMEGPWTPIAKNVKNEGRYRWSTPSDLGLTFVRLVARDAAGNNCQVHTPQAVATDDLSRPRGRVLGVSTMPPK